MLQVQACPFPQMLLDVKSHINPNTIVVDDFNILLASTDKSSRKKQPETSALNEIVHQVDLADTFRLFQQNMYSMKKYKFFSAFLGMLPEKIIY